MPTYLSGKHELNLGKVSANRLNVLIRGNVNSWILQTFSDISTEVHKLSNIYHHTANVTGNEMAKEWNKRGVDSYDILLLKYVGI